MPTIYCNPQTEMRLRIWHALKVSPELLDDIEKWAEGSFQVSDIRGTCKDDSVRHFATFEELHAYKNDPDGELCTLSFSLNDSKGSLVSATISNASSFFIRSDSAYFDIAGDNDIW